MWCISLLLGLCLHADAASGQNANLCPVLNTEIDEHTAIGTVVFSFNSDTSNIQLIAKDPKFSGMLKLEPGKKPNSYNILLQTDVDLNILNPRSKPAPQTDENVDCKLSEDSSPLNSDLDTEPLQSISLDTDEYLIIKMVDDEDVYLRAVEYTLRCSFTIGAYSIPVTSDVRVAIRDVNDNAPTFLCFPYYKTISEMAPLSTTVFQLRGLAADLDIDGGISGFRLESDGEGAFGMQGAAADGIITVTGPLDYDHGPRHFELNISVMDIGDPPRTSWTTLYVRLEDGDDQNPVLGQDIYRLELPEKNDSILYNKSHRTNPPIRGYDQDLGINASVEYQLISGHIHNGERYFSIDPKTGEIRVLHLLDISLQKQFILQIKVFQTDNPINRFSHATVLVTVQDINDHIPEFLMSEYNITLMENSPNGQQVAQLMASDMDEGLNAMFSYFCIDPGGAFHLDPVTGTLTVEDASKLDREKQSLHTLIVYALETKSSEKYRSENVSVFINLLDANDNSPVFDQANYTFYINESISAGSTVGKVYATDKDLDVNANIKYSILFGTEGASSLFIIKSDSGEIVTRTAIEDNSVAAYMLTVEAQDQPEVSSQTRRSVVSVTIDLVPDVMTGKPYFVEAPYQATVTEDASWGTTVIQIQAAGGGRALHFDFDQDNIKHLFHIDRDSGVVTVQGQLDREMQDTYDLRLTVSDDNYIVFATLVITIEDVNDNTPVFEENVYYFNLTEEQPAGTWVGTIQADDVDEGENGFVRYEEASADGIMSYFRVDATSGVITTSSELDREKTNTFQFLVVAKDNGSDFRTANAMVYVNVIDINDNRPLFSGSAEYTTYLPERSKPGFLLQIHARDEDWKENGEILYTLTNGDNTLFHVDSLTGFISTKREVILNKGGSNRLSFDVVAYNPTRYHPLMTHQNDSARVYVFIQDVNDNSPSFTMPQYNFEVYEDSLLGSSIGRVVAYDGDWELKHSLIRYWICNQNDDDVLDKFMVDEFSGVIKLMLPLDRDQLPSQEVISFNVSASDFVPFYSTQHIQNTTAMVNIRVLDVNDCTPQFSQDVYTVFVPENVSSGSVIFSELRATDCDEGSNGEVFYYLEIIDNLFILHHATGLLTTNGALDFDKDNKDYTLKVLASDKGQPPLTGTSTVRVIVTNVNDNAPRFEKKIFQFELDENLPAGTVLGFVTATDLDGDRIMYTAHEPASDLVLVTQNGLLITQKPADRELQEFHKLFVLARDERNASGQMISNPYDVTVSVLITILDQNDNNPQFTESVYNTTVEEGAARSLIAQVRATDADSGVFGEIIYEIFAGNEADAFELDPLSGELWVLKGDNVNYTSQPTYDISVIAKDGGNPTLRDVAIIRVYVLDINNHVPRFTQQVYKAEITENSRAGTHVTQVHAEDPDSDTLIYRLDWLNSGFNITPYGGYIYTVSPIDRDSLSGPMSLNVFVFDGIHEDFAEITVVIIDENDNPPMFDQLFYEANMLFDASLGQTIITVNASDMDLEHNAILTYWMTGGEGKFIINPDTGEIKLGKPLSESGEYIYNMTVFARDHGYPALTSHVPLTIYVTENNRHAPQFMNPMYQLKLPEDFELNKPIITFNVTDRDIGLAGQIFLYLTRGNTFDTFYIDDNYSLLLAMPLDYEIMRYYELEITAVDQGKAKQSNFLRVRVTVTDINDNAPLFTLNPPVIRLHQHIAGNEVIHRFIARDGDSNTSGNNRVTYRLKSSMVDSEDNVFSIDNDTGEVRVTGNLSRPQYWLGVIARDHGSPRLETTIQVSVEFLDLHQREISPFFHRLVNTVRINESAHLPQTILDIDAKVPGQAPDESIFYEITRGESKSSFNISHHTGELQLILPLDREISTFFPVFISATHVDNTKYKPETQVLVIVDDSNDNPPAFPFHSYEVAVFEDTRLGHQLIRIAAEDPDLNPQLTYQIENGQSDGHFAVTSVNNEAVITLNKYLDLESMPSRLNGAYSLSLSVSDGYSPSSSTLLKIHVVDVNDNPPIFPQTDYFMELSEDAGNCMDLLQVSATDPDLVDRDQLKYSFMQGIDHPLFVIHNRTGVISTSCDSNLYLDREESDHHVLTVVATDTGGNQAEAQVLVKVLDVNDITPTFINATYEIYITEGLSSLNWTIVVKAEDQDIGNNSHISFSLESNINNDFSIHSLQMGTHKAEGVIRVINALDREKPGLDMVNDTAIYPVIVVARDNGKPSLSSSTTVRFYISDINDNAPKFLNENYGVTISEDTPVGTTIVTLSALDADVVDKYNLLYSLEKQASNDVLAVNLTTGAVTVKRHLDVTLQPEIIVRVQVSDNIHTSTATLKVILIDVNNQDPVFLYPVYHFRLYENDASGVRGQFVGQVSALDKDYGDNGEVLYNISSSSVRGIFNMLKPDIGNITVIGVLDREEQSHYSFTVTAKDKGVPSRMGTCDVHVEILDVNDNSPEFITQTFTAEVDEHAAMGTIVSVSGHLTVTDKDVGTNADISYALSGPGSHMFHIDPQRAVITVMGIGSIQLDRERQDTHLLEVLAMDREGRAGSRTTTSTILISVRDINDHAPELPVNIMHVAISEAASPGSPLITVQARDMDIYPNNRLFYSLTGEHRGKFYVDKLWGEVFTSGGLDREVKDHYLLTLTVSDTGTNPFALQTTILINVTVEDFNDNAPLFGSNIFHFDIAEHVAVNTMVGEVRANDNDLNENGNITYKLLENVPFHVDPFTGAISTHRQLDREKQNRYTFVVMATDMGVPRLSTSTTVTVTVNDVNDHVPYFDQGVYKASVLERSPVNSLIGYIIAHDPDEGANAKLTYSLSSTTGVHRYFEIDSEHGFVRIRKSISLASLFAKGIISDPTNGVLVLSVSATDNGHSPKTGNVSLLVYVDETNDNSLFFSESVYNVTLNENAQNGTLVTTVDTTEQTANTFVQYTVFGSTHFSVNTDQFQGIVTKIGDLDREDRPEHIFAVRAVDNKTPQRTAYAMVVVRLADENDNYPVFNQSRYEFVVQEGTYTIATAIGAVSASDSDSGENGHVKYIIQDGVDNPGSFSFVINETFGSIQMLGPLDHEVSPTFDFNVIAYDQGVHSLSSSVEVSVTVLDINDNSPIIHQYQQRIYISDAALPGSKLAEVFATDVDSGLNGVVMYDVISEHTSFPFYLRMSGSAGVIRLARPITYDDADTFNVTVVAYDLGTPSLTSTSYVLVNVNATMETRPRFDKKLYKVTLPEDTPTNVTVFTVRAGNGQYQYSIAGQSGNSLFSIRGDSGELMLNRAVSTKDGPVEIVINAKDLNAPHQTDWTRVRVEVVDIGPQFTQNKYTVQLAENQPPPLLLIDLNTTEEHLSHHVQYYFHHNPYQDIFNIDKATGQVFSQKALDRETLDQYIIQVGCRRPAGKGTYATQNTRAESVASLVINVEDVNDNKPIFTHDPFVYGVPSNVPVMHNIGVLKVKDADIGESSMSVFNISGDSRRYFYVTPLTGHIYTTVVFNKQDPQEFNLVAMATDAMGTGFSTRTKIKIFVLAAKHQAILLANTSSLDFQVFQDRLLGNLSALLGFEVHLGSLQPHQEEMDRKSTVDTTRTDAIIYAVNRKEETILWAATILKKADANSDAIQDLFKAFNISSIRPMVVTESSRVQVNPKDVALILLACLVFLGVLVGIVALYFSWNQKEKAKLLRSIDKPNNEGGNPMFQEADLYAEPFDSQYANLGDTVMSEASSEGCQHTYCDDIYKTCMPVEYASLDEHGNTIMVVDKQGSRRVKVGPDAWTEPYSNSAVRLHRQSSCCSSTPRTSVEIHAEDIPGTSEEGVKSTPPRQVPVTKVPSSTGSTTSATEETNRDSDSLYVNGNLLRDNRAAGSRRSAQASGIYTRTIEPASREASADRNRSADECVYATIPQPSDANFASQVPSNSTTWPPKPKIFSPKSEVFKGKRTAKVQPQISSTRRCTKHPIVKKKHVTFDESSIDKGDAVSPKSADKSGEERVLKFNPSYEIGTTEF